MSIRLVIGCCNYVFGEGLKKLLQGKNDIEIIGIFDESTDLKKILRLNPDVILTDINLFYSFPSGLLLDNSSKIKILLLGERPWLRRVSKQIPELVSKGVYGILPPGADSKILRKAIKVISKGELWLDHKIIKDALSMDISEIKKIDFTKTENEVLSLICQGYRNKEIAQQLNINEQTVKSYCNRIYKKVGVSDKVQLILYIFRTWPDWFKSISKEV